MTSELTGTSFIGNSRGSGAEPCGQSVNPATSEQLQPVYLSATPEEIESAMSLADAAFPVFSAMPGKTRAIFLRAIAAKMTDRLDQIAARGPLETGLPEARIRGESARTIGQLNLFAALIEEGSWVDARIELANPTRQPLAKPDLRSMLVPLGPVAVFCASNFPLAYSVAGGDTASALAAGCPVVVIGHHSHMGVAEIVAQAVVEAASETGMPEGVFSLLYGGGRKVGAAVVKHPVTAAVGFTGSRAGGVALMEAAAARPCPIPVYAEMSAVNPIVVLPGALGDEAKSLSLAEAFFGSLTLGCGQFCTNPGLVFLPENGAEVFSNKLKSLIESANAGVMLNAGIAKAYADATASFASQPGVETLAASQSPGGNTGAPLVLTASAKQFAANPVLHGEMFGPACVLVHGNLDETHAALVALEGQLTATIHGTDEEISANSALISQLRRISGRLIFNGFPTGVEVCSSMVHGGPFPATSDGRSTSVGSMAIFRFCRPAAWQNAPQSALPPELQDANPLGIHQQVVA